MLRRLDGLLQGDHRTLMRGAGLDLADLREYQHHDDVRHIDWNVTARLQTALRAPVHRRPRALGLVPGRPVGERRLRLEPLHQAATIAREFVAVLARLLTRARQPRRRPALRQPGRHRAAGARRPRRTSSSCCSGWRHGPAEPAAGATDLREPAARRRSARSSAARRIFVVSDFVSAPGWEHALGQLAQRHEVTAVRLFDALEMDLPDIGLVTMKDAETGEQIVVDTHNRRFRERFAAAAERRETPLREALAPRRRRHPRARHRRRPRRRRPALRRPEEAAQPPRQLERPAGRSIAHVATVQAPAASAERAAARPLPWMTFPLAQHAVGDARAAGRSSRSTSS